MDNKNNVKHNIIILGDSHVSGAASKLQENLNADFAVTSTVKPGAPMNAITNTASEAIKSLTSEDLISIWGGSNDISRNNSKLALNEVHNFVINNPDSNIILINAPQRHDLIPASCVNAEVLKFNRQIKRIAKLYSHMHLLEPNLDRSHFTVHGMHFNYKGKAQSAKNLAELVKKIFSKEQLVPIATPWDAPSKAPFNNQPLSPAEQDVDPNSSPARSAHQNNLREPPQESTIIVNPTKITDLTVTNTEESASVTESSRSSNRSKKPPVTRSNDFLWAA
jgi:lysophospholipase L1-like esterase